MDLRLLHRDMPGLEVLAGDLGLRTLAQLSREPIGGRRDRRKQRLARVWTGRARAFGDGNADAPRDFADGGRIVHPQLFHKEGVDVARFVAHEAVEHPFFRDDGEVAMRAAMERAGPAVVCARALELDMLPDDPHEVRRLADLLDDFLWDHRSDGWTVGRLDGVMQTPQQLHRVRLGSTARVRSVSRGDRASTWLARSRATRRCPCHG